MAKLVLGFILLFAPLFANAQKEKPHVILVSFDGFRSDYVERYKLPNFRDFIIKGASAEGLIPSFPSKTFPNHYTIVTGLYPGNHGLVDNEFYDPALDVHYTMKNKEVVTNKNFYGGTPLWQLCRQQGLRSASYFWVGSELKEENLHPDYYFPYDQSVPNEDRVAQVIDWLKLPQDKRPRFISLYFSSPDHEGHTFGPIAEETRLKLLAMDSLLGKLMSGVRSVRLPINVVIVSDHGMKELIHREDTFLYLNEIFGEKRNSLKFANGGTQVHLYLRSEQEADSLYDALQSRAQYFSMLKQSEFPDRWHYRNKRSGNLMLVAEPGYYFTTATRDQINKSERINQTIGVHGYDPLKVRDMYGIFYAQGPNIRAASKVPAFENIHIYPLIAQILGLALPPIDGKEEILKSIYKK
jgi:predicted AlkP superfamily pyrophosphatase or phosphodiesterase